MKNKLTLLIYIALHFVSLLLHPVTFIKKVNKAITLIRKNGWRYFYEYFLSVYLPKIYLHKKKFVIASTSGSIYKKVTPLLPKNFFSNPSPTYNQLSVPLKILVIRFGAMGDVLLTTPIIKKLFTDREGFVEIYVATRHPEVFKNSPYVKGTFSPKELRNLNMNFGFILDLDSAYKGNKGAHLIDVFSYYAFGSAPNLNTFDKQVDIHSTQEDISRIERYIEQLAHPFIVCHNRFDDAQKFRGVNPKIWQQLLLNIVEKHAVKVIQIGGIGSDICLTDHPQFVDARNAFSLQETKELIAKAQLYIGIDAGPLHIAAATNTPIVSFFTQSHASTRKPLRDEVNVEFIPIEASVSCYGCIREYPAPYGFECVRGDSVCSESFSSDEVYERCKRFLP